MSEPARDQPTGVEPVPMSPALRELIRLIARAAMRLAGNKPPQRIEGE